MSSSDIIRWGGLAAMVAGLAFILDILAGLGFTSDNLFTFSMRDDWTNAVYIVAALLMVVGLLGLHTLQKDNFGRYGRIGRGGFWTVVVASLAQVLGLILYLIDIFALIVLVFPVGVLAIPVGLILYGVATL